MTAIPRCIEHERTCLVATHRRPPPVPPGKDAARAPAASPEASRQLAARTLPALSLRDLCAAQGGKLGTPSPRHRCQTSLLSVLAPGSPLLKGPAEWGFHRPLRGGNKRQGRLPAALGPHSRRTGQVLGGLGARFQRHLDIISSSTVWPVGWGGAGGRGQKLAGG